MSLWSRISNVLHHNRLTSEIDEELQSHIHEAIEQGRDPAEARKAFGSHLRQREKSQDVHVIAWLESLRADAIFGLRRLRKNKLTSAAAILSLAIAIGACTSAFRLIDALLLRPLPVTEPNQLYALSRSGIGFDGKPSSFDGWAYPDFCLMRAAVKDQAELIALSYVQRMDLTYNSDREMEKAHLQYVSGWMFSSFGLRPTLGRLLTADDDLKPLAHPYAVLSHDYWTRRFAQDPNVIGRTFRIGVTLYQIIGVGGESFTGTEPGTVVDIFVPTMMHAGVGRDDWTWFRTLARMKPGIPIEPVRQKLAATTRAFEEVRSKGFVGMSSKMIENDLNQALLMEPASSGVSGMQQDYRRALVALGVLVALVLLSACANVANLMIAQAAARAREMALRVSIGAGRWRLVQLVLVESAWVAFLAATLGALFAWWSAPFVLSRINPPANPARLVLVTGWRELAFSLALVLAVTCLFGLAPALRASAVKPASALKGGDDPHSRRRLMHTLIAVQVAFSFLVLFVSGLFIATFDRLSNQSTGFSAERLLTLNTVSPGPQPAVFWDQVAEHLRTVPGVEAVALASWPLLDGDSWNSFLSINGAPPTDVLAHFLSVSPGWLDAMKIPLIEGRDFRAGDNDPGVAIVSETFAKQFFKGENPIGKSFERTYPRPIRFQIVGLVRDVRYRDMRERILPVAYFPFHTIDTSGGLQLGASGALQPKSHATFIVRTSSPNPLALASALRQEVPRARPEFRVNNILTQAEIIQSHTVRERLLAMLALFFAVVALLLAGVGLYGVLDYSVLQRRREIGIRMAIGAQVAGIVRLVTGEMFAMVLAGALAGLALGLVSARYIEALFYDVKATDASMLAFPSIAIIAAASLAALPAVVHAIRIDPVKMLRNE